MRNRIAIAALATFTLATSAVTHSAEPAADLPEILGQCATEHALGLAKKQPSDSPDRIVETPLQLCYQENLEAQNAFRTERMRQNPPVDADELVALWDIRRAALRASLVATVQARRASPAPETVSRPPAE